MYKEIFESFDKIKAPHKAVDKAVACALKANSTAEIDKGETVYRFRKPLICALAACVCIIFTCTLIFGLGKTAVPVESEDKTFVINAGAYGLDKVKDEVDDTVIGAYAGELTGGWAMYENLEKDTLDVPNFFQSYALNSFVIEGEDIESVTFKSTAKGTYFALSPHGFYSADGADKEETLTENFIGLSLKNSKYSADELSKYKDGLSYGEIFCDTFTYCNVENEDTIDISRKIEFVIESDHKDPAQAQCLNEIWLYEEEAVGEKLMDSPSEEKLDNLYLEMSGCGDELQALVLKDATVDVIVNFSDGTTKTKTLLMGLVSNENGRWLTISQK